MLTQEQYQKAIDAGFSQEQIIEYSKRRDSLLGGQPTQTSPQETGTRTFDEGEEMPERGFFKTLFKRPAERLLLEPARRTTELLISTLPVVPDEYKERAAINSSKDMVLDIPFFGEFQTKGLAGGREGVKQVAGETLESAAWLYAPARGTVGAIKAGLGGGLKSASRFGAKVGGIGGGMFGAGEALQQDGGIGDVAVGAGVGGLAGAAGGAVISPAISAAPVAARHTAHFAKTGYEMAESMGNTLLRRTMDVAGIGKQFPERIIRRTAEDIAEMGTRRGAIRESPKHVGEAMKQGVEDIVINFVRKGTLEDKLQRAKMLEIAKKGTEDLSFLAHAKAIPGETIVKGPTRFLIKTAREGSKKTEKTLESLPNEPINAVSLYNRVVDDFKQIGLEVQGRNLIRTRGSRVPDQDMPFFQQIFREMQPDAKGNLPLTYKQMDNLRDRWYQSVKKDQTFTSGVRGPTGYLNRVRSLLGEEIDKVAGGEYMAAQQQTAEALAGMKEFVRLIGHKGYLDNITTKDLKAGESFLKVFGDAADRPLSVLDNLYGVARKYGYNGRENVIDQLKFADVLESIYGQPSRNIGSQLAKATSPQADPTQVIASSAREMVKWSPYSGAIRFLRARGLLGRHEKDVMRAFENLIRGEAGLPLEHRRVMPIEKSAEKITKQAKEEYDKIRKALGF